MKNNQEILEYLEKVYRLPHDIEIVAADIYAFMMSSQGIENTLLQRFQLSVQHSNYPDIVSRSYAYLSRLAQSDGLMEEEILKIVHLYDSINIFFKLGLTDDLRLLEQIDIEMMAFFTKYRKNYKQIVTQNCQNLYKPWWSRLHLLMS